VNVIWRTILVHLQARLRVRRGRTLPLDGISRLRLTTLPTDIDILRHMNNGRYLSLFDLGRWDLLVRTRLWDAMRSEGWYAVVAAETVAFRRSLQLWQRFDVESRMLGHDDVMPRGEVGHERQPASGSAGAVEDQERTPCAAAHQRDVAAVDGEFRR